MYFITVKYDLKQPTALVSDAWWWEKSLPVNTDTLPYSWLTDSTHMYVSLQQHMLDSREHNSCSSVFSCPGH